MDCSLFVFLYLNAVFGDVKYTRVFQLGGNTGQLKGLVILSDTEEAEIVPSDFLLWISPVAYSIDQIHRN